MKITKIPHLLVLLICFCLVLLSSCGTTNNTSASHSVIANKHTPAVTATAPSATSTPTTLSAGCPPPGIARGAFIVPETGAVQPAVFYMTEWGGVQSGINPFNLMRYDLTTGKATSIFTFTNFTVGVMPVIQLSPNKHWLLVTNSDNTTHITKIQLIRTDGTQTQTLACYPSSQFILRASWLPDSRQIAITKDQYDQKHNTESYTVDVLNLATEETQTVLSGNYSPYAWLDDRHLVVEQETKMDKFPSKADFYLFDTNNGSQQKLTNLPHIASFELWGSLMAGDIAVSSDSSQVFISSFAQTNTNTPGCQGTATQGPGTLKSYTINSGSTHSIYSDQKHAIMAIQSINSQTLLMYIENNIGDLSQNGLWKINSDGSSLTRLTTANDPQCRDTAYSEWGPQIAHNDQSYALLQTDFNHDENQSIVVGALSGGTPTTIATSANVSLPPGKDHFERLLQLVGMA